MNYFYVLFILLLGIMSSVLCYGATRKKSNFGTIFCLIWTVEGVFTNLGIKQFYLPGDLINICIITSFCVFSIVYLYNSRKTSLQAVQILDIDTSVNLKAITVANVIIFLYMIPFFLKAIRVIATSGFAYLRFIALSASEELGTSTLSTVILQSICYPIIIVSFLIGIVLFFLKEKHAIRILLFSIINITVYCLSNASRNGFVICIMFTVIAYLVLRFPLQKEKIKIYGKNHKLFIFVVLCAGVAVVLYISKERTVSSMSFSDNAYMYFFGGPSFVTQLMKNMDDYTINQNFMLGTATFGFIYNIFAFVLNFIGIRIPISDNIINGKFASVNYFISPTIKCNAMSTVFFPFLMDWGYAGIVIGPALIAICSKTIEKRYLYSQNLRWTAFTVYWYYFMYRTIFKYDGVSISFFFTLLFLIIFTSNRKNASYNH